MANSNLMWQNGGPYLNYTDGATCGNNQKRYTLIAFICGAEGSPNISVVVKDEPCYVIIHRNTDLVCEKRVSKDLGMESLNFFSYITVKIFKF